MKNSSKVLIIIAIVIVILLILGIVAPRFYGCRSDNTWNIAISRIDSIKSAINEYNRITGQYPKTLDDLLICPRGFEDKWLGPYLKKGQVIDPWDNMYIYDPNGKRHPGSYDIISYGKDGKPGGEGYNADIYN